MAADKKNYKADAFAFMQSVVDDSEERATVSDTSGAVSADILGSYAYQDAQFCPIEERASVPGRETYVAWAEEFLLAAQTFSNTP